MHLTILKCSMFTAFRVVHIHKSKLHFWKTYYHDDIYCQQHVPYVVNTLDQTYCTSGCASHNLDRFVTVKSSSTML